MLASNLVALFPLKSALMTFELLPMQYPFLCVGSKVINTRVESMGKRLAIDFGNNCYIYIIHV